MSRSSSTLAFCLVLGLAGFGGRALAQEPLVEVLESSGEGMVPEDSVPQVAPDGSIRVLIEGVGVVGVNKVVSVADQGYRFYWRILRIDEKGIELKRLGIKSESTPKSSVPKGESIKENES